MYKLISIFFISVFLFSCATHSKGLKAKYEYVEQLKAEGKRPRTVNDKMDDLIGKPLNSLMEDIKIRSEVQRKIKLTDADIKAEIKPIHSGYKVLQVQNDYYSGRSCITNVYINPKNIIAGWDFLPIKDEVWCREQIMNPKAISQVGQLALAFSPVKVGAVQNAANEPKVVYITQMTEGSTPLNTPIPKPTPTRKWVKADEMANYIGLTKLEVIDKQGIADRTDVISKGVEMMVWTKKWSSSHVTSRGWWGEATGVAYNDYKCHVGVVLKKDRATGWKISGNCSDNTEAGGKVSSIIPIPKSRL